MQKYFKKWLCVQNYERKMLKVYEEVSLVDHIINLYGPNIIIGSAGNEQNLGVNNLGFVSEETDYEAAPPPPLPPPVMVENVNIKKAFNQSIIQQKKLSCIYDQDKVTMNIFLVLKGINILILGEGRNLCPEKGKSPADASQTCQGD